MRRCKLIALCISLWGIVGCGAGATECQKLNDAVSASATRLAQLNWNATDDPASMKTQFVAMNSVLEEEAQALQQVELQDGGHRASLEGVSDIFLRFARASKEAADLAQMLSSIQSEQERHAETLKRAAKAFDLACAKAERGECDEAERRLLATRQPEADSSDVLAKGSSPHDILVARLKRAIEALSQLESEHEELGEAASDLHTEMSVVVDQLERLAAGLMRLAEVHQRIDTIGRDATAQFDHVKRQCPR